AETIGLPHHERMEYKPKMSAMSSLFLRASNVSTAPNNTQLLKIKAEWGPEQCGSHRRRIERKRDRPRFGRRNGRMKCHLPNCRHAATVVPRKPALADQCGFRPSRCHTSPGTIPKR